MTIYRTNAEKTGDAFLRLLTPGVLVPLVTFLAGSAAIRALGFSPVSDAVFRVVVLASVLWGLVGFLFGVLDVAIDVKSTFGRWLRATVDAASKGPIRAAFLGVLGVMMALGLRGSGDTFLFSASALPLVAYAFWQVTGDAGARNSPLGSRVLLFAPNRFTHAATAVKVALIGTTALVLGWEAANGTNDASIFLLWTAWLASTFGLRAPAAELGVDGVYIRGWRPRFVPFTGREKIIQAEWGMDVMRDEERLLRLRYRRADAERREEVVASARAAITRKSEADRDTSTVVAALVAQKDNAVGDAGYRRPGLSRDELWRVVAMPEVETRVRVHAAKELRVDREDGDDERLQEIAESSADPKTRATLLASIRR